MSTCDSGKVCYPSAQAAWSACVYIRTRNKTAEKRRVNGARAYRCPSCPWWHVTSTPRRAA